MCSLLVLVGAGFLFCVVVCVTGQALWEDRTLYGEPNKNKKGESK